LGLSPLAEMDKSLADNKIAFKLLKLIYDKQNSYYDFKGLHHFKSKFSPEWHQSFLAYPSQMNLPKVLLALLKLNQAI
jgi:phosphatidylglycerol lysyltransferase